MGLATPQRRTRPPQFSRWPRWFAVRRFREVAQMTALFPLIRIGYAVEVRGREHLSELTEPCLIISNHNMHLDWSAILRSLPRKLRGRTTVAAAASDIFGSRRRAFAGGLFGNAFPFDKEGSGVRKSLEHTKQLLDEGWNVLIFPEGKMNKDAPMAPFKSGIGWLAVQTHAPVLPLRIDILEPGIYEGARFPKRGRVRVNIGAPLHLKDGSSYGAAVALLEQAVRDC
jgi:1-acyl-sn-glycerol-3-phosphate acyltransferase